ncbi:MAG: type II methionyl aminopeptidase [Methanoregula sp.]|nr:type II methionyl aminopeptidase [Methanoregula sp.]
MKDEILDNYKAAGSLAAKILRESAKEVRVGGSYLELVDSVESRVKEEGAGIAFPLNVSLNEDAAHDTASTGDERTFSKGDVIKLDLGVEIEGYIADTATTVDLGNNSLLLDASREALEAAIKLVRAGVTAGELGAAVEKEITSRGYRPIANLTGHGLDQYVLHKDPTIPNISIHGGTVLEEGMAFAIEPFATTGSGHVGEKTRVEIYSQIAERPVRIPSARAVIDQIKDRKGMPFSRRWLRDKKMDLALIGLSRSHIVYGYPVLSDIAGSLVSQHEHTLIVTADGCIVTTR